MTNDQHVGGDKGLTKPKTLSYVYHGLCLSAGYLLPVTIGTLLLIPFFNIYAVGFPMMVFVQSWQTFIFAFIMMLYFKSVTERSLCVSYFVCSIIAYLSIYYFRPTFFSVFVGFDIVGITQEQIFLNILKVLGIPLIYTAIWFAIYFKLIQRRLLKG